MVQEKPCDYEPRICQESPYALLAWKYTSNADLV